MKTTIFTRILIATLLPVFLVLLIVVMTARSVIYRDGTEYAQEFVRLAAKRISDQTANKLDNTVALQSDICRRVSAIDLNDPGALDTLDGLLQTLILADRDLYCTWYAFEPDTFSKNRMVYRTLIRKGEEIVEADDLSVELLSDEREAPWYRIPLKTGHIYADVNDYYDFKTGEGAIHVFTMTYPIIQSDGTIIGCVGLDIRYEDLFPISSLSGGEFESLMLLNDEGTVLFASNEADIGKPLRDFNVRNVDAALAALAEKSVWQGEADVFLAAEKTLVCLYPVEVLHAGQTIYLYRAIPAESLYSSFLSSMEIIIVTGAMGMTLLCFCVFFTTRGIVRHVKRITDSFYNVARDDTDIMINTEYIPLDLTNVIELDTLQSALISMMIQLRRAHELRLQAVAAEVEKEKLIASAEARTNFFASMSHEIRTPMNAILGISEILLHEGGLSVSQEKHIKDIKVSSDALLRIINDILDISRLETGKMELRPEHFNFHALVDNLASLSFQLAADAGLQFIFRPEGDLPICLYGDEARFRQVLLNLIGNAVKFTREGYVMLRVTQKDEKLRFDIVDTGIGIRETQANTIFEAFKQVDTRRNREIHGTGLGLSISKNIVELMGGNIELKSVYGEGSTFSVTIPLVLGDESKLRKAKPSTGIRFAPSLRVLIVDDNEINLSVSSGLFKAAHGIFCDTANSGRKAIDMAKQIDYDIIFMDHMMPEMDGVDTTQFIRRLGGRFEKIPIIALTANAVSGTRQELINGGMDDFLAKPIQNEELRLILETWVPEDKRLSGELTSEESADDKEESERATPKKRGKIVDLSIPGKEVLEEAGLDIRAGLENVGRDKNTYIRSLRLLYDFLPQTVQSMETAVEQGSIREFRITVHGMKGSLASIGAAELSSEAYALEMTAAGLDTEKCRESLPAFIQHLEQFRQSIGQALPAAEDFTQKETSGERPEDVINRLCSALETYDYDAINTELTAILSMELDAERNTSLAQIKQLIDSFEYPAAIAQIKEEWL